VIPLEPLLAAMGVYVLGELGIETTKKMLKHASRADEAGQSKPATATQSCPLKPDDDDPCKHLRSGDPNGPGKYRGGAHGETKGPTGDGLDSHHTPAAQANELGGGPARDDAPAIQMEPEDHADTASYGSSEEAKAYRLSQTRLVKEGKLLEAAQMDIDDIKKVAAASGDPHKYDQALNEMKSYADCLQNQINKNK
jgi:hypothetical protein